jgi:uncharacterized protein (DUF2384 family)
MDMYTKINTMAILKTSGAETLLLEEVPLQLNDTAVLGFLNKRNINWKYLKAIKLLTGYNDDVISGWFNVSVKTLRTYRKPSIRFKQNVSEHVLLLLSLFKHGIDVFGSSDAFDNWLGIKNFYLDNKSPVSLLNTASGIRFINDRLTAMEFGDNV